MLRDDHKLKLADQKGSVSKKCVHNYTSVGWPILGIFDSAVMLASRAIHILNLALYAGSSKQGKARLASVG